MQVLGENSVLIDCDVLQADGGTRTASVTGAYVAMADAIRFARKNRLLRGTPLRDSVAAVSVGVVRGRAMIDLDYEEDVAAEVDMNVVMNGSGEFVEVQGTGERSTFTRSQLDRMIRLGAQGVRKLIAAQQKALRQRTY
jgi:ribonuclease PH